MQELARELDVRPMPPPERHPAIFRAFDALDPGEAFVLVNDHDPKPLLYQLQAERAQRFEWSVLEAGPERWQIEIGRRAAAGPRGVAEFLTGDHRRLDAILAGVERLAAARAFAEAGREFGAFACGLDRHISMEEEILFPAFERATGMAGGGPTAVMRLEHAEIRRLMEEIRRALAAADADRGRAALGALEVVLSEHNVKEEQVLYPASDRLAGGDRERDDLVRQMQAR